jgi:MGT family glycosyltransferase
MSRKFLFVTWEGGGTLPPQLAVARRLIARGHEVCVLAEPPSRGDVEAAGARYAPFVEAPVRASRDPSDDPFRDWEKNPLSAVKTAIDRKVCGPALAYAHDVLRALEAWPADAVVADGYLFGAMIGAEKAGLPAVAISPDLSHRPMEGRPPMGPGLAPARGPLGRARDAILRFVANRLFAAGLTPVNAARRSLGLEPLATLFEQMERMDQHLLLTCRAFDYPTQPPPNVRYVGAQLDDPIWEGTWAPPGGASDEPLVLVSLGSTFQQQEALYRRIIAAFEGLPMRALVTLGGVLDPAEFSGPPNVTIVDRAPHVAVLEHAAAMVSHCGHGSVLRSLAAGVPLVCLPIGRDQNENAARVAAHGAGLRLRPGSRPAAIRHAIEAVVEQASFTDAARRLATAIAEDRDRDLAVESLESLVGITAPAKVA